MADSKNPSDYLVVGDPKKSSTWHLQVKREGKPDHDLMGAAWAALTSNHRGNAYSGPNKSEALAKLKKLYASEKMPLPTAHIEPDGTVLSHFSWKLSGSYPDIPLNDGISMDEIKQIEDDPVFLSLPLMKPGMVAKEGFVYTQGFVQKVMSDMQSQGNIANMGHVARNDRDHLFPMPKALWVGAMQDNDGMVWGKAWLRDSEFKTLVKQMKAANAEIATSVYGTYDPSQAKFNMDGTYEINPSTFKLESVDFAPPARAALQFERGVPVLTSHMNNEELETNEMTKEELLAQMTVDDIPSEMREAIIAQFKEGQDTEAVMAQMRDENTRLTTEVETLRKGMAEVAKNAVMSQFESKLSEAVKVDTEEGALKELIRGRVLAHLAAETKPEEIDTLLTEAMDAPVYKTLATVVVAQMSGGAVITQVSDKTGGTKTAGQLAEENKDEILARLGIHFTN